MKILRKTSTNPNYLFGLLPQYFKENDTYKDGNGEGLLERYLEIFCREIDYEVVPYIDNVGYLYDALQLSELPHSDPLKFLDHIAELFGNPPNIGTEAQYQVLLRYIIYILRTKGTFQSLLYFLAIYGYTIHDFNESSIGPNIYDKTPTPLIYDDAKHFDWAFTFYSGWDLVITDLPGLTPNDPGAPWLANLKLAIQKFIAPIFATLGTVTYTI